MALTTATARFAVAAPVSAKAGRRTQMQRSSSSSSSKRMQAAMANADNATGRRAALFAAAGVGMLVAPKPAQAYLSVDPSIPPVVCGQINSAGFEYPKQAIGVQSRDFSRRYLIKWLCDQLCEEFKDIDEQTFKNCWRLALLDAASGTSDGSIRFELDRPYAEGLKPTVEMYEGMKKRIESKMDVPLSYADLYALGGKVASNVFWRKEFAGQTGRFPEKSLKGLVGQTVPVENIDDDLFKGQFLNLYAPVALTSQGTPVLLGRIDATGPSPEGIIPAKGASAAELKAWFEKTLNISYLNLVALSPFLDTDGTILETISTADTPLKGFVARDAKDSGFPGLVEKRAIYAYTNLMVNGNFSDTAYCLPAFVKSSGWSCRPPIKDFDFAVMTFNKDQDLSCKPIE